MRERLALFYAAAFGSVAWATAALAQDSTVTVPEPVAPEPVAAPDTAATPEPRAAAAPDKAAAAGHWGVLPPQEASNTAAIPGHGQPVWEKIVNFPYNVAFLPIKLLGVGVERAVEAIDEEPKLQRVVKDGGFRMGDALLSGGVSLDTGDGAGANVSLDVRDFGALHHAMKLRLAGKTRGERRATLALRFRRSDVSRIDAGGGYRSDHNARFYGIGPRSDEDSESFHRKETAWGGATWAREFGAFGSSLTGLYTSVGATGTDHSDAPHLSEEFAAALPFGYRDRSEGFTAGWALSHENTELLEVEGTPRRERHRPEYGGLHRAVISWFQGKGDSPAEFWTWRLEAQHFLPLPHSQRGLALRGAISRIENEGDDPIPFQRLLTNDDPDVFRGYPDGRFHDIGLVAATAEYRWPIWAKSRANGFGADGYLFTDLGQVFSETGEIAMRSVTKSYGGGIRVGGDGNFMGRVELGWSEEGIQFRLRADQLFQFEKGGLFFGRSPVPDR